MQTKSIVLTAVLLLAATGCSNVVRSRDVANPAVSGRTLAVQVCSNCHGSSGNSVSPNFPNLAAQQPAYLSAQLDAFRAKRRKDPAGFEYMWGLSAHLSDRQIAELSDYFAKQPLERTPVEGRPERIVAGKAIFESGLVSKGVPACNTCHGPQGMGNEAFPRIAGQHVDYLRKQLASFQRSDERPDGAVMQTVAHQLSREDIADVAAYAQTLRAP